MGVPAPAEHPFEGTTDNYLDVSSVGAHRVNLASHDERHSMHKAVAKGAASLNSRRMLAVDVTDLGGSASARSTKCEPGQDKWLEYLDRHDVDCLSKKNMISGFYYTASGCPRDSGKFHYNYVCEGAVHKVSNYTQKCINKTTVDSPTSGKSLEFLDKHNVDCGNNRALSRFKLGSSHYEFTCCDIPPGMNPSCTYRKTECSSGAKNKLQFLDRHQVVCDGEDEVMSRFQMTKNGCSGDEIRYEFRCCKIHTPSPPPMPPSPPPAPPPLMPPPWPVRTDIEERVSDWCATASLDWRDIFEMCDVSSQSTPKSIRYWSMGGKYDPLPPSTDDAEYEYESNEDDEDGVDDEFANKTNATKTTKTRPTITCKIPGNDSPVQFFMGRAKVRAGPMKNDPVNMLEGVWCQIQ